jgi:hypothetical protein
LDEDGECAMNFAVDRELDGGDEEEEKRKSKTGACLL